MTHSPLELMFDAWRQSQPQSELWEARLRRECAALEYAGLSPDEVMLLALRRVAADDDASRQYAQELAGEAFSTTGRARTASRNRQEMLVAGACALLAAVAVKVPAAFGTGFESGHEGFYLRNASFFVLPLLLAYLTWLKRPPRPHLLAVLGLVLVSLVVANLPFAEGGSTQLLTALHLPILLWLSVGVVAAAGRWRAHEARVTFMAFTGAWFVTYVLIALGGGVLTGMTTALFEAIGVDPSPFVAEWMLPCGAAGAVLVAAWLVTDRSSLMHGIAPMLARVFTPLFTVMLVVLMLAIPASGQLMDLDRDVLILFDLLLVVVLALLIYATTTRNPLDPVGIMDRLQLLLVSSALVVDAFALISLLGRIGELGFTPNKLAALGLNILLLGNLAPTAWLQLQFLRGRRPVAVADWQMRYLPLYAIWAAIVAFAFPLLYRFA